MTERRSGEFAWIAEHFAPLAGEGAFGFKDDAAFLDVEGKLIVTHDTIVEGIHFLADDPADDVAVKALGVNASDIIAKGGTPIAATIGLGVPDRWTDEDAVLFAQGLTSICDAEWARTERSFHVALQGGDTTRSPERMFVSVAMFGRPGRRYVSRIGATPGDAVVVCGPIGDAVLGLGIRQGRYPTGPDSVDLLDRYRRPCPTWEAARLVAEFATASMDVSDGLVGDLAKLCAASGVGADLELREMPVSQAAESFAADPNTRLQMATGGDDYVVLMTVPSRDVPELLETAREVDALSRAAVIGWVRAGTGVGVTLDGVPVNVGKASYTHD